MKKNLYRFAVLTAFALTTLSASSAAYMKLGDIKGQITTSNASHKGEIEIYSWSFGASNPSSATGCSTGPLKFAIRGAAAEGVKNLCRSRVPTGTVTFVIDGVQHRFEGTSFASCQNGDGTVPADQFSLNFTKCTYHRGGVTVAAGDVNGDGAYQVNARLTGLRRATVSARLESLKLNPNGTSATVTLTKVGAGTLALSDTNSAPLPQVVLELTNGTKWTFTKVTFGNVVISSATEQFTMNFTEVEGPRSGYSAR